jgi:hypothetical protein
MLAYRDTKLTRTALGLFFLAVAAYGYFELRGLLWGPTITLEDVPTLTDMQVVTVAGAAAHIATLSMNGGEIPVTEDGGFSHQYLLAPGYNRIVLDAKDKYGTATQKVVEIVYSPAASATTSAGTATDTPGTAAEPATTTPATTSGRSINTEQPLSR